mmetsp:Transcript_112018/g.203604  ORF Transcript_112018/g.203604 Transcript_112018/m.203604 type:complete len:225 (+) Transcript_112018:83-757(+)
MAKWGNFVLLTPAFLLATLASPVAHSATFPAGGCEPATGSSQTETKALLEAEFASAEDADADAMRFSLIQKASPELLQSLPNTMATSQLVQSREDPKGGHRPFFAQLATYLHRVKRTRTGRTQGLIDDWTSLFPSLPSITVSLFIAVVFVLPVICYCCIRVVEESEPDRKAFFPDDPRRHPQPILRLDFNTGSGWNGCIGLSLVSFLILGITYAWSTGMGGMML